MEEVEVDRIAYAVSASSLGAVMVACSARGLCAVLMGDDEEALERLLRDRFPRAQLAAGGVDVERVATEVAALVEAPGGEVSVPLDVSGTEFQRAVWAALREIPAGETASYAEIAARIGRPRAVRAVGAACGANALALVIPCHRVVRSDGGLSGFLWGVERKRRLLIMEGALREPAAQAATSPLLDMDG